MKYQLRRYLDDEGFIYKEGDNRSIISFFWPGSVLFNRRGFNWKEDDQPIASNTEHEPLIGEFDSIEEIEKWLFETYFEWFL